MIAIIKGVLGTIKFLMILGIFEYIAPGFSHAVFEEVSDMVVDLSVGDKDGK